MDGKYLYNRCHLVGYQMAGENANEKNLITGTRYLNIEGMLPFENQVADYVQETGNHVAYRVTPIFEGENMLSSGVLMEGWSVEDKGGDICFCVYAYNVQPDITIDYATWDSFSSASAPSEPAKPAVPVTQEPAPAPEPAPEPEPEPEPPAVEEVSEDYILNKNTKKFHLPGCSSVKQVNYPRPKGRGL